jgi:hypothetical protein
MPEYRIRRDGQQYLVFSGSLAAEASDRLRHGQEQDRWTDIRAQPFRPRCPWLLAPERR